MSRTRMQSERGAAAVELALVLPVVIGLAGLALFAGWLGWAKVSLDHGVREGLRFATLPQSGDLRSWPEAADVAQAVEAGTPLISPTAVTSADSGAGRAGNQMVEVIGVYKVSNPVAVLLAPLAVIGLDDIVPHEIELVSRAKGRRE